MELRHLSLRRLEPTMRIQTEHPARRVCSSERPPLERDPTRKSSVRVFAVEKAVNIYIYILYRYYIYLYIYCIDIIYILYYIYILYLINIYIYSRCISKCRNAPSASFQGLSKAQDAVMSQCCCFTCCRSAPEDYVRHDGERICVVM